MKAKTMVSEMSTMIVLAVLYLREINSTSCREKPVIPIRDCASQQLDSLVPCGSRAINASNRQGSPAGPSALHIKPVFDYDPSRDKSLTHRFAYLQIIVLPPQDDSIKYLKGFKIELLNMQTNRQFCYVKDLTNSQFSIKNISQTFYFCIGSVDNVQYHVLAHTLPTAQKLDFKSQTIPPLYQLSVNEEAKYLNIRVIDITPINGTSSTTARVVFTFLSGTAPRYVVYFLKTNNREMVERRVYCNTYAGQIVTQVFALQSKFGVYNFEIEPMRLDDDESDCLCPVIRHYMAGCDPCPRALTQAFILANYNKESKASGNLESNEHEGYEDVVKKEPNSVNMREVLILVISIAAVVFVLGFSMLGFCYLLLRKSGTKIQMKTSSKPDEFIDYSTPTIDYCSAEERENRRVKLLSVSQVDLYSHFSKGSTVVEHRSFNCQEASEFLNQHTEIAEETALATSEISDHFTEIPITGIGNSIDNRELLNSDTQIELEEFEQQSQADCYTQNQHLEINETESRISNESDDSFVPYNHIKNMPGGRKTQTDSDCDVISLEALPYTVNSNFTPHRAREATGKITFNGCDVIDTDHVTANTQYWDEKPFED